MNDPRNRDYDKFFQDKSNEDQPSTSEQEQTTSFSSDERSDKPSAYYSYGPYRSQQDTNPDSSQHEHEQTAKESRPLDAQSSTVEVIPPQHTFESDPYRQHQATAHIESTASSGGQATREQQPRRQRRMGWLGSFVAAFLSCALIMTGLVYASDVNNWFTGGQVNAINSNEETPVGQTVSVNKASGTTAPSALPGSIADIVDQSSEAVVLIETYVNANRSFSGRTNRDFFEYFFGDRIQVQPEHDGGMINAGLGTGFIFDQEGYILTNEHVVSGADEIYVTVQGYTEPFKAEMLGADFDLDLAVLKITGKKDFATLPIGDSSQLRVGEWVTAIGNPLGYDHTVSVGVLSAKGREIQIPEGNQMRYYENLLQTDASINSGNSGGPLLNMNGEVVGINTAVSTDAQGIGFAIPSSTIVSVLDLLKENETIPKPYIGVGITNIEESWLEDLQLNNTDGALVTQVEVGSPAARAGIQTWDVITKINDQDVQSYEDVKKYVTDLGVGSRITIMVMREGKEIEFGVIIGDRNNE